MIRCEAKTTKKAWDNPLAPMAQCERAAKSAVPDRTGKERQVCGVHAALAHKGRYLSFKEPGRM